MPMSPVQSAQAFQDAECRVRLAEPAPPQRERLAIQMKVGSNTFQASGDPQDVWSAVAMFRNLTEPRSYFGGLGSAPNANNGPF